jgi:amidase
MAELHHLSALQQGEAVRRREVSPVELVEHYLGRIERLSDEVGAFVTVTGEQAVDSAKKAESAVLERSELPLLFGVPTAVKDLNLVAGVPVHFGSAAFPDLVAPIDDNVVTKLRTGGLIFLGKTNTPEFGLTCYTEPDVAPPARTPFDLERSAGGSSGGAAAAVAAGLVPVAQGSDGAGSIRIPASACGLVGVKTSRGRVSIGPIATDPSGLAVHGPLARTVTDAAALLDVMAGTLPGDPYWAPPLPEGESFLAAARRNPGRMRIGITKDPVITSTELDPRCIAAFEQAAELLESLGHETIETSRPFGEHLVPEFETIWAAGAASLPIPAEQETVLRSITRWLRGRGASVSATRLLGALANVGLAARQAIVAWSGFDAVLTPTLAEAPALLGAFRNDDRPDEDFEAQKRFTPFTAPVNLTGQPAVSLPLYWDATGLPIGVQLIGRPAGEAQLLSLAAQLEAAHPWHDHLPRCW